MRERSELARKGIARGRSVVVLAYDSGVLFVAENPSRSLQKVSELYDRVGFAAGPPGRTRATVNTNCSIGVLRSHCAVVNPRSPAV